MAWLPLTDLGSYQKLIEDSFHFPVLIFKHSTRCGTSGYIKERLTTHEEVMALPVHWIDVIRNRDLSQHVAATLAIHHESPQLLVISDGECIWAEDHYEINALELLELLANLKN